MSGPMASLTVIDCLDHLLQRCIEWHEVGSRVTCDPPVMNTDRDILCLVPNRAEFQILALQSCFDADGSQPHFDERDDKSLDALQRSPFISLTCHEINLIVTDDPEFARRFMAATRLAKRLNLLAKGDRIALFQAVLYGN